MPKRAILPTLLITLHAIASMAAAIDVVAPAELITEPPTLHCLSFRWMGSGDDNLSATVEVHYRRKGARQWRRALDLIRIEPGEGRPLLAGSIFDLEEGTTYECRLTLRDPDGVAGQGPATKDRPAAAERLVTVTTAAPAEIPEEMDVRHVYMAEHRGDKAQPAHVGLLHGIWGGHLYNRRTSDWAGAGDVVLIHAGYYKGKKFDKRDWRGHLALDSSGWHGYPLGRDCPDGRPLVIKAAGDGEVIIDGSGMPELFDLSGARNVIIEGLTIRNAGIAFQFAEARDNRPSRNVTIRNCIIRDVSHVAYGDHPDNRSIHIVDCILQGRQQAVIGSWGSTFSRQCITVNGRGHVFNHNRVVDFFDYVNVGEGNASVEIANNDIRRAGDNAICLNRHSSNCVAIRNRIVNGGDPQLDNRNRTGPTYWIRNVVYNSRSARGFKNDGGIGGMVALHNTMTLYPLNFHTYAYGQLANNLFLGGPGKGGKAAKACRAVPGQRTALHHNGWLMANAAFLWAGEAMTDQAAFHEASGLGQGAVAVDFSDFRSAPNPHGLERDWPHTIKLIDPDSLDLRLADGSAAIDAGAVIPGVNDDYTGEVPDLGAYERGKPVPHYGPRGEFPEPFRWRELLEYDPLPQRPAEPGQAVMRVSCGTPWDYQDPYGRVWLGERRYRWPRQWGYVGNPNAWHDQRGRGKGVGAPLSQVYRFERGDVDAYVFTLPAGDYVVRMHFVERWGQGRVFDVFINNKLALDDLDIFTAAGGDHKPVTRDIRTAVRGDKLRIDFIREAGGSPIINGLEIFRVNQ